METKRDYWEQLRDKVAADLFIRELTAGMSGALYDELIERAEEKELELEEYIMYISIDYANKFIARLKESKLNNNEQ